MPDRAPFAPAARRGRGWRRTGRSGRARAGHKVGFRPNRPQKEDGTRIELVSDPPSSADPRHRSCPWQRLQLRKAASSGSRGRPGSPHRPAGRCSRVGLWKWPDPWPHQCGRMCVPPYPWRIPRLIGGGQVARLLSQSHLALSALRSSSQVTSSCAALSQQCGDPARRHIVLQRRIPDILIGALRPPHRLRVCRLRHGHKTGRADFSNGSWARVPWHGSPRVKYLRNPTESLRCRRLQVVPLWDTRPLHWMAHAMTA